jgi:5-methylcytosine-specific restriction endonuclease McrA
MALKTVKPRLTTVKPRLQRADASGHDIVTERFRPFYHTTRWRRLRMEILTRDLFTCKMCNTTHGQTRNLVCDHIKPHMHRDEHLFWDENNLQTLCAPCHSKHKQAQEAKQRRGGL